MKIYTKTGDHGTTSLASGGRVSKADIRVEMYGTCDELISILGLLHAFPASENKLDESNLKIQNILFELGSELAGFRKKDESEPIVLLEDINFLEIEIDRMQESLPVLKTFILPGGTSASSFLHLGRTVCRRLERLMVGSKEAGAEIFENSLVFINRLSDYLFVAARYCNYKSGIDDVKWYSRAKGKQSN
jgi:cob(I)alamin adenosyltransferase